MVKNYPTKKQLRSTLFSFILLTTIASIVSSCADFQRSYQPQTTKTNLNISSKIPLKVALVLDKGLLNFTTSMIDYNHGDSMDIKLDVGKSVSDLFRENCQQLFDEVIIVNNFREISNAAVVIIPKINFASTNYTTLPKKREHYSQEYYIEAKIELGLEIRDRKGNIVYQDSKDHLTYSSEYAWLSDYGKLMAKAEQAAFNSLVYRLINSNFIASTKMKAETPSALVVQLTYSDIESILPNNIIDAGEESRIKATITNNGSGTAFAVKLASTSKFTGISFPAIIDIGDILPGASKTAIIPISANLNLITDTAKLLITANEKRGYDSRPTELQIATAEFLEPKFSITSCSLGDSSGLANGDGDGIPENSETIEVSPFIKNSGQGDGLWVDVKLTDMSPGIEIIKGEDRIVSIGNKEIDKVTLAFKVPYTYSGNEIRYTISVTDVRGVQITKRYKIAFAAKSSELACTYQLLDSDNREVSGLENGKSYVLSLSPKNNGENLAEDVQIKLTSASPKVNVGKFNQKLGRITPQGKGRRVTIPLSLERSYLQSSLNLNLKISQKHFAGLEKNITLPVIVSQPKLSSQSILLNGVGEETVSQNSHPKIRVSVSNNGAMNATNVKVHFKVNHPDIRFNKTQQIGTIKAGENKYQDFSFYAPSRVNTGDLPVQVTISQADFDKITKTASFHIEPQEAIVQKIKGAEDQLAGLGSRQYVEPQLHLNSPNNNAETYDKTVNIHGSVIAIGKGNAVQSLSVAVNGDSLKVVPVTEAIRLRTDRITKRVTETNMIEFDGQISLKSGTNIIEIVSTDRNNQTKKKTVRVVKKDKLGDIYAVVLGVSQFADTSLNLEYAASDAKKFYDFLRSKAGGELPEQRIVLLTDHNANRAAIIKALTKFLGTAGPDDTVEIYLATHGVVGDDGVLYYLTHNTEMDNLIGTSFSTTDFDRIVGNDIEAGRIIVYLDACHSGLSGLSEMYNRRGIGVIETNQRINSLAAQLSKAESGVATFSASSSSGFSIEDSKWDGGVFTYHLLKGLQGEANENNDEWISIGELENYLASEVRVDTEGKQKPKMNGTLTDETPVAKIY